MHNLQTLAGRGNHSSLRCKDARCRPELATDPPQHNCGGSYHTLSGYTCPPDIFDVLFYNAPPPAGKHLQADRACTARCRVTFVDTDAELTGPTRPSCTMSHHIASVLIHATSSPLPVAGLIFVQLSGASFRFHPTYG